ncbi:MAG: spore coat protein [Clostridia bacterium]|nr:spore coat protein [Clostridia bacterium]MCI8962030.1 spore coat protein [Clostridia bacterium]
MDEKTMVNDILNGTKEELKTYQGVITETDNMQLRSTIQQIRNNCESFQYELYRVAQSKGYYKPAEQATPKEISQVKTELEQ